VAVDGLGPHWRDAREPGVKYIFRRTDNDQLVEVDFDTMMTQQGGYITLPDGAEARRCAYLEKPDEPPQPKSDKRKKVQAKIVSMSLGCTGHQVKEFRKLMADHKIPGELVGEESPHGTHFYNAIFPSWRARDAFAKLRGITNDRNSRNGGATPLGTVLYDRAVAITTRRED